MFSKYPMLEVDAALSIVKASLTDLGSEIIPLEDCLGRVLSSEIRSPIAFPPFRASVMDGYAVHSSETPGVFPIFQHCRAGDQSSDLPSGHCSYITTGAALPLSADAVVPVEEVKFENGSVTLPQARPGQWIREVGSDIAPDTVLGSPGQLLTPQHLALIASVGLTRLQVLKTPRIGLISTGNELRNIGENLGYGEIVDTNRLMLKMLSEEAKCTVKDYGILRDSYEEIRDKVLGICEECDFVVSSGGVSMGDKDFVKPLVENEGQVLFGRVNMKPGKPMTFGRVKNSLVFALPGNPASCFVCFYLFVRMAIDCVLKQPGLPLVSVRLLQPQKLDPRPEFHRAVVAWDGSAFQALSTGPQQSSRLLSTVQANAILHFPSSNQSNTIEGFVSATLLRPFSDVPKINPPETEHFSSEIKVRTAGILIVSDRAFRGVYEDKTGPLLEKWCKERWECRVVRRIVPDEKGEIKEGILAMAEECDVVITSGGTGFGSRDVTPEATREVIEKEAPGLVVKMLCEGMKNTEFACLSRMVAGAIGKTLVVNFPGSVGGVTDCFNSIYKIVPHAVKLLTT
jgi:gephyrin